LGLFFWIAGILQAVLLLVFWFKTRHTLPLWKETKWLVFWFLAMVYVSFWFTIKPPAAHIYFVFFPFILLYSCYVWSFFSRSFRWRLFAKSFVACAVVFQLGYAVAVIPTDSFYAPQESGVGLKRDIVVQALRAGNYRIMGDRRSRSLY
jgi:hypothetical protein